MATEKIEKAIITGPLGKLDAAIHKLVVNREFHISAAHEALKSISGLGRLQESDPYRETLDDVSAFMESMGVRTKDVDYSKYDLPIEGLAEWVDETRKVYENMYEQKLNEEVFAQETEDLVRELEIYGELNVDLAGILSMKSAQLHFGSIDEDLYGELAEDAKSRAGVFLYRTGMRGDKIHCIYVALDEAEDRAAEHFLALGFEYEDRPEETGLTGVPKERIQRLRTQAQEARQRAEALEQDIKAFSRGEREKLQAFHGRLSYLSECFRLREMAAVKGGRFYLTGWVPVSEIEHLERDSQEMGLTLDTERPSKHEQSSVPVKFKNSLAGRIFSPFVEIYGHPAYGEADPRPMMLLSYGLLFGIMFGDVGQGAVFVILGLILGKGFKNRLGPILSWVGCFSVIFGFVYGSVFGDEHTLPGFKIMEGNNIINTLAISAVVGVVLIVSVMIMNIVTGFRQNDFRKALFSANGLAGMIVYVTVVACGALTLLMDIPAFTMPSVYIPCLVIPLVCMFCGETLARLLEGHKDFMPHSWGMFFVEGFFEIFEAALSWFSNTASFLRVGAYAISHAGTMMVVYLLAADLDGVARIAVLVVGNVVVMGLEGMLVCIQTLRLHYYELFSRFYTGRGTPFAPVRIK